ncbi:MAG: CDP-alcohol phosphatidyltransferase family protein [Chloroflexi bacterium]|nr:CDP-alcohol phosphatidyltransferase family protein [Chloroflexota bacterium]
MREVKDTAFRPLVWRLRGMPPLLFTLIGLLFGLGTAVAAGYQLYALAFAGWFLNRSFDALDGGVARQTNRQSDLGGYLDILLDYMVYAAVPIGLVLGRPSPFGYVMLAFLLGSFYINAASWMYLAALLEKRAQGTGASGEETSITMPAGLIGGTETIIFYGAFILFAPWVPWLFALMAALVVVTIIQRLLWAVKRLD